MIVVTIELWPYGDESTKRTIGTLQIANDGTGDEKYGNYIARISSDDEWKPVVKSYNRHLPVQSLVRLVLEEMKYDF